MAVSQVDQAVSQLFIGDVTTNVIVTSYAGSPEGNVTANTGSLCVDTTNGALYVKTGGNDADDWKVVTQAA